MCLFITNANTFDVRKIKYGSGLSSAFLWRDCTDTWNSHRSCSHFTKHCKALCGRWVWKKETYTQRTESNKTWEWYINNSLHLARKYAKIFVLGHYLFLEANSFPRAQLEENCALRGTDYVQGQISEHIFAPNGGYRVYYPANLFRNARSFKNWGYSRISPSFSWGIFGHVTCLDQSRVSEKIWWIINRGVCGYVRWVSTALFWGGTNLILEASETSKVQCETQNNCMVWRQPTMENLKTEQRTSSNSKYTLISSKQ